VDRDRCTELDGYGQWHTSFALAGNNDEASIATAYEAIIERKSEKDWISAEKKLNGPYTGNSARTQRRQDKKLRDKEKLDVISRERYLSFIGSTSYLLTLSSSASATAFKKMFAVLPQTVESNAAIVPAPGTAVPAIIESLHKSRTSRMRLFCIAQSRTANLKCERCQSM
jgi:hypothetical protein